MYIYVDYSNEIIVFPLCTAESIKVRIRIRIKSGLLYFTGAGK